MGYEAIRSASIVPNSPAYNLSPKASFSLHSSSVQVFQSAQIRRESTYNMMPNDREFTYASNRSSVGSDKEFVIPSPGSQGQLRVETFVMPTVGVDGRRPRTSSASMHINNNASFNGGGQYSTSSNSAQLPGPHANLPEASNELRRFSTSPSGNLEGRISPARSFSQSGYSGYRQNSGNVLGFSGIDENDAILGSENSIRQ